VEDPDNPPGSIAALQRASSGLVKTQYSNCEFFFFLAARSCHVHVLSYVMNLPKMSDKMLGSLAPSLPSHSTNGHFFMGNGMTCAAARRDIFWASLGHIDASRRSVVSLCFEQEKYDMMDETVSVCPAGVPRRHQYVD
jgi:hypothetical protein